MESDFTVVVACIIIAVLCAIISWWGDLVGLSETNLVAIGICFLVFGVLITIVAEKILLEKTNIFYGPRWFCAACISVAVIILIMAIWLGVAALCKL